MTFHGEFHLAIKKTNYKQMKVDVLLGLQWGDEGKGKIVDVLTPKYNVISRFQGGPNAGHTLEINNFKQVLHTIPSGIFHENKMNVIGNGVVIDPITFEKEIESISKHGVNLHKTLYISKKAHLILPTHRLLDAASEEAKGATKIGSTLKGIGPTYRDKIGREGLRVGDLFENFTEKYKGIFVMQPYGLRYHVIIRNTNKWNEVRGEISEYFNISNLKPSLEDVFIELVEGQSR